MKKLILSLALICVIAGCSNSTAPDDVTVIGTWLLSSDDKAEWIGSTKVSKAKSDTILFASPEHTLLQLSTQGRNATTNELIVDMMYIDSTITTEYARENDLWLEGTYITFEGAEIGPPPYRLNSRYGEVGADSLLTSNMQFLYTCENDSADIERANIDLKHNSEENIWDAPVFKTITLEIAGFKQVLEQEFCIN